MIGGFDEICEASKIIIVGQVQILAAEEDVPYMERICA